MDDPVSQQEIQNCLDLIRKNSSVVILKQENEEIVQLLN